MPRKQENLAAACTDRPVLLQQASLLLFHACKNHLGVVPMQMCWCEKVLGVAGRTLNMRRLLAYNRRNQLGVARMSVSFHQKVLGPKGKGWEGQ